MTVSNYQVRTARILLGWTQDELAGMVGVSGATISLFESNRRHPPEEVADAIRAALEAAGVIFVIENGEGSGVRLRKGK
jgi:transcriptional regulator with XRE-family HTH domain